MDWYVWGKTAVLCHTQIFDSDWVVFTKNFIHDVVRFMTVMAVDCPIMCGPCTNINISSLVTTYTMWLSPVIRLGLKVVGLTITVTDVFIWTILTQFVSRFQPFICHENTWGEERYSSTLFLTSALERVRGQHHAPAATYTQERTGTHYADGIVGLRSGLDRCGNTLPHRDLIPDPSSPYTVAVLTTLPGPTPYDQLVSATCASW